MPTFSPIRACIVLLLLVGLLVGMTARVAYLQTYGRQRTIHSSERQQHRTEVLRGARRGTIYERNGLVMAGTIQTRAIYLDPKFMQDSYQADGRTLNEMDEAIAKLARLLDRDPDELTNMLGERYESRYVKIAENVDDGIWEAIQKMDLPGLGTEPINIRFHPMGSLAAHILGSLGKDDTGRAELGLEGVELKFDKLLAGDDGWRRVQKDARRRVIGVSADDYVSPKHGQHLVLTIDANIQMIAEQELAAACEAHKAKRGEVVVMDPKTGEVLAMANYPTFDPETLDDCPPANTPAYQAFLERRRNNVIVCPYECGSVIKPFVAGPALAWGITTPTEMWPIPGISWTTPYGRHITDVHGYPHLALWDVLVKSSNIGMAMLGERMGNAKLYQALKSFRFGSQTGIELPGEDPGLVNPLARWTRWSADSVATGYELMVTPLQLARAFCAYANGGRLVQPRLVRGTIDTDGGVVPIRPEVPLDQLPQAIDPATAAQVRRILADVPVRGTARGARSQYWNIFGKTGTSHISDGAAGYAQRYNSSYMCGAPYENPRIVVTLVLHEPTGDHYGGAVSAPAAMKIVERTLAYMQVPCSPELAPPPANVASVLFGYNPAAYRFSRERTALVGD